MQTTKTTKFEKHVAWQRAEDKADRAKIRWQRFGRNCEVAKREYNELRDLATAAYRTYKQHQ